MLIMLLTEYDEIETMKMIERDAHRKGMEEGQITLLLGLVKDKLLSITEAAKRLNISESEFQKLMTEQ